MLPPRFSQTSMGLSLGSSGPGLGLSPGVGEGGSLASVASGWLRTSRAAQRASSESESVAGRGLECPPLPRLCGPLRPGLGSRPPARLCLSYRRRRLQRLLSPDPRAHQGCSPQGAVKRVSSSSCWWAGLLPRVVSTRLPHRDALHRRVCLDGAAPPQALWERGEGQGVSDRARLRAGAAPAPPRLLSPVPRQP